MAVLRPGVRQNLVAVGSALGLRPFDTNLVIAIVQDRARTGSDPAPATDLRLTMLRDPAAPTQSAPAHRPSWMLCILSAVALAVALFVALVRWVMRP